MTTEAERLLKDSGWLPEACAVLIWWRLTAQTEGQGAYMAGRAVTCTEPSISLAKLCTLLKPHFCFSRQIEVVAETCA